MVGLDSVMEKMNKDFKETVGVKGLGHLELKRIPFTSPRLNYITYGGVPRGRLTMFAGKESSGKSTTALDIVKNAQITFRQEYADELADLKKQIKAAEKILEDKSSKKGAKDEAKKALPELKEKLSYLEKRGVLQIVYFDAEGTIDKDWAKKLGVDVEDVWIVQLHQQTAEQFLDQVLRVVRDADNVGLVIIDSIAVLVPQLVHGESLEQKSMGGNAAVVTMFCNEVCPLLGKKNICMVAIQQVRDSMNPYAEFTIPGGNALKLACSLIMIFQKGKFFDAAGNEQKNSFETPQGNQIWCRIQKTKISKCDRRCGFYSLNYDYGVDVVADLIPMAIDTGVIAKAGSWFSIVSPSDPTGYMTYEDGEIVKFQGQTNMMQFLRETPEAYNFVERRVMAIVSGNSDVLAIDAETDAKALQEANDVDVITVEDEKPAKDGQYEAPDEIPMEV